MGKAGKHGRPNRQSRTRKRRHYGNQFTAVKSQESSSVAEAEETEVTPEEVDTGEVEVTRDVENAVEEEEKLDEEIISLSHKKLKLSDDVEDISTEKNEKIIECNFIVNSVLLINFLEKYIKCPDCGAPVKVVHDILKKRGLSHTLETCCTLGCWKDEFCTSRTVAEETRKGRKAYDINTRAVIAFRENGKGYKDLQTFCTIMNIPPPMNSNVFNDINNKLHNVYCEVAEESMVKAAKEIPVSEEEDGIKDVVASFDGSWQRRGYSSLNGVVTCISNGKVVDTAVMSKVCASCKFWNSKKSTPGYEDWERSHICPINHTGSAGAMESAGTKTIFHRSVEKRGLRYVKYLGDGDSKSFADVVASNPYTDVTLEKYECIGHVQKRVGARLRAYKIKYKGKVLDDKKSLTGKGRLTNKVINTLQNYYGMIVRSSKDLCSMKKGIAAILYHCSEFLTDDGKPDHELRHQYCPRDKNSWCKYQKDKHTGKCTYKCRINIPEAVREIIKPIFSYKDLGSDELLKKCLHGQTQNVNESFNNIIWKRIPKNVFVFKRTLELGVASAVISFNDGAEGLVNVFKKCGLDPGQFTLRGFNQTNLRRVRLMDRKMSFSCKTRRKKLRALRKGWEDKHLENEGGETYSSGNH